MPCSSSNGPPAQTPITGLLPRSWQSLPPPGNSCCCDARQKGIPNSVHRLWPGVCRHAAAQTSRKASLSYAFDTQNGRLHAMADRKNPMLSASSQHGHCDPASSSLSVSAFISYSYCSLPFSSSSSCRLLRVSFPPHPSTPLLSRRTFVSPILRPRRCLALPVAVSSGACLYCLLPLAAIAAVLALGPERQPDFHEVLFA